MIEIYFDDVLLDSDNYIGFSYSKHSFDKDFYLGSVASIEASLIIPKDALPSSLENVRIDIDGEDFLHLVVDEISINDNEEAEIKLTDQMINLGVNYDISEDVPISAGDLLEKICDDFNLDHDEFSFDNSDVILSSYDETLTAREYLGMIAELAGGYAQITSDGKLELKYYSNNNITNEITVDDIDSYKIKDDITIERVVYEFGAIKKESDTDQSKYTLYLSPDNMFLQVITDEQFENICDKIIGFTFSNIEIPTTNLIFGNQDLINFVDMNGSSHTILNEVEADYGGGFVGTYNYDIQNSKQEFTEIKSSLDKINRIKIIVDQQEGKITQTIERVSDLEESIEVLSASVDTNVIVIGVDDSQRPFTTKTYTVNYEVKYLGTPIILQPTTEDTHTGITCTISNGVISFAVNSSIAITDTDNKYTFEWEYTPTGSETSYTVSRSIVISTLSSEVEQNVIISDDAPTDTNVLWYDSPNNQLKRYESNEWVIVNDYSSDIASVNENINNLSKEIDDKISIGYDSYKETTDTEFVQDKIYYIHDPETDEYIEYTDEREGDPSQLGLFEKQHYAGLQSQINTLQTSMTSKFEQTNLSFTASINTLRRETTTTSNDLQTQIEDIIDYVSFDAEEEIYNPITQQSHTGVVTIGKSTMETKLKLASDILFFDIKGTQVAYIGTDSTGTSRLYIKDAEVTNKIAVSSEIDLGNFGWKVETDDSLTFGKVK